MRTRSCLLWISVTILLLVATASCATSDEVSEIRKRVQLLEAQQSQQITQQQQSVENIHRWIVAFDEETELIDQQLSALNEADSRLSVKDDEIIQDISELKTRLDERMLNKVLATPWKYLGPAIAILLFGILLGVLFDRLIWVRSTDEE